MANNLKDTIFDLEISLMTPSIRKSAESLDKLLSDDFIEFGSSGRVYSKKDQLKMLPKEEEIQFKIEDFTTRELSRGVVLATYTSISEGKTVRRSSIWTCVEEQWEMSFHQGTPCNPDD